MESDPFDLVGDVLDGQFRVDTFIDEGNLSVVYKGHHLGLNAPIAVKCLNLPSTLDVALVQPLVDAFNEAACVHYRLARRNLNIAQSIACGTTLAPRTGALVPYLVREWFEGESLASELGSRRARGHAGRSPEEALALLDSALDGVAFAHREGITHLSLNPSNLFLARRAETVSLKVLDFGVARTMNDLASELSSTSARGGLRLLFPAYAAPEQLDKKAGALGPWTDVYALALIAIECLSDRVAMSESDTGALVEHALDGKRRPTPQAHGLKLPHALDRVLTRAVSLAPKQRQQSADELWDELRRAVRKPAAVAPARPLSMRTRAPAEVAIGPRQSTVAGPGPHRSETEALVLPALTRPLTFDLRAAPPAPSRDVPLAIRWPPAAADGSPLRGLTPVSDGPQTSTGSNFCRTPLPSFPAFLRLRAGWDRFSALTGTPPRLLAIGSAVLAAATVMILAVLAYAPASAASAAALAGASLPVPPAAEQSSPASEAALPQPGEPFSTEAAWRALYSTSHEVAGCRRGKVWGGTTATVTFGNDGSVNKVVFRRPFARSTTATCVASVLESVRAPPFHGKQGIVDFWFYVRPR